MSNRDPRPHLTGRERVIPFLEDARLNFALMRKVHGRDSDAYTRLLRHYRTVADELGCRLAVERAARVPHRHRLRMQRSAVSCAQVRGNSPHRQGDVGGALAATGENYTIAFKIMIARRLARAGGVVAQLLVDGDDEAYLPHRATRGRKVVLRDLLEGRGMDATPGDLCAALRADVSAELIRLITRIAWPRKDGDGADEGAAGANCYGGSAS